MKSSGPCVIGLGANTPSRFGSPQVTLETALERLPAHGVRILRRAAWIRSAAYPPGSGPDFVNGAALIETDLSPHETLTALHAVEAEIGRIRTERYAPRSVDLDLLLWGDLVLPDLETYHYWRDLPEPEWTRQTPPDLILPHPRIQDRSFVEGPVSELVGNWRRWTPET